MLFIVNLFLEHVFEYIHGYLEILKDASLDPLLLHAFYYKRISSILLYTRKLNTFPEQGVSKDYGGFFLQSWHSVTPEAARVRKN